jgi:hypothetical protein
VAGSITRAAIFSRRSRHRPIGRRKVFFFEKKKQKTFRLALLPPGASLRRLARNPQTKGFCFFFSKNKALPSSSLPPEAGAGLPTVQ